jgi:hypothetical protein
MAIMDKNFEKNMNFWAVSMLIHIRPESEATAVGQLTSRGILKRKKGEGAVGL